MVRIIGIIYLQRRVDGGIADIEHADAQDDPTARRHRLCRIRGIA